MLQMELTAIFLEFKIHIQKTLSGSRNRSICNPSLQHRSRQNTVTHVNNPFCVEKEKHNIEISTGKTTLSNLGYRKFISLSKYIGS